MHNSIEDINSEKPYGSFAPNTQQAYLIGLTRRLPNSWVGKRLGFTLRKLIKRKEGIPFDLNVFGMKMRLYPHDNKCENRVLCLPQLFDPQERKVIKEFITLQGSSPITFIDLGANVGLYSLYIQSLLQDKDSKNTKIIAVEADPYIYERLKHNVLLNNDFINIVQTAISNQDGHTSLHINTHNRGENSIITQAKINNTLPQTQSSIDVTTTSIKTLLERYDVIKPSIMKLDLEGAEELVLSAFFDDVGQESYPNMIIVERDKNLDLPLLTLLQYNGYTVQSDTRNNRIFIRPIK